MGVYVFIEGYVQSDYGRGAAISLLMVLTVIVLSFFYVRNGPGRGVEMSAFAQPRDAARRRARRRRLRRAAWNAVGLAVFVVSRSRSSG